MTHCLILRPVLSATALTLCSFLPGCDDPYVERTMQHDRDSAMFALRSYGAREARCQENLENVALMADEQWQDDVRTFPRGAAGAIDFFQEDVEEWPQKRSEAEAEIARQLAGDLLSIQWTLPRLLF